MAGGAAFWLLQFWRYCAHMPIPDTLRHQIEMFRETGHVVIYDAQGFAVPSHVSMLMGLGVVPRNYDPLVDLLHLGQLHAHFARVRANIRQVVATMPGHADYIARQVPAEPPPVKIFKES